MKNSAIKIVRSTFNKKNYEKLNQYLNKKTIFTSIILFFLIVTSIYLIKPYFYNYNLNKDIFENKIKKEFEIDLKINGKLSYNLFPYPRINIKKAKLKFSEKKQILIDELHISIPLFISKNIKDLKLKKIIISEQTVQVYPKDFKSYFKYYTIHKEKNIYFKNCNLFFLDEQKNKVFFENFYLTEKSKRNLHAINIESIFSQNKFKINFINKINGEKKLDIIFPQIGADINVVFDESSNLSRVDGKSKIKLLDNIFVINFKGKDKFKIYDSFLRNKFINSKIDGDINVINNLFFDLNLDINQIKFRKLLLNYFPNNRGYSFLESGLIKKVNGKINILIKNTNSFIGRINNLKMKFILENGDIRIQNGTAFLPHNSKINFNLLFSDNQGDPFLDFNLNFDSDNTKKFLRKLNVYNTIDNETLINVQGKINLINKKVKFRNIILNKREKLDKKKISSLEKNFNEFVLKEGIIGLTDFFRLKKFINTALN